MKRALALAVYAGLIGAGCAAPSSQGGGVTHPVQTTSAPVATPDAGGSPSSTAAPAPAPKQPRPFDDHHMRTAALASFAIGATAGIFAVGSSIQMLADEKTRSADCNAQKVCSPAGLQANSELGINGATNVALWAVTISGLGVGTFLILTNPANRASTTSVGIAPNASGANLMVRGLF